MIKSLGKVNPSRQTLLTFPVQDPRNLSVSEIQLDLFPEWIPLTSLVLGFDLQCENRQPDDEELPVATNTEATGWPHAVVSDPAS